MSLREKLNAEIKNAMINKNKERLSALRLLLAEVKKQSVDLNKVSYSKEYAVKTYLLI